MLAIVLTEPDFSRYTQLLTLEGISLKMLHEGRRTGGWGGQSDPSPPLLTPFIRLT